MTDPRIPDSLRGYEPGTERDAEPDGAEARQAVDPLGWCVIATTALLAWLFGPIAVTVLAAIGFGKYWRAWRSGQVDSRCILGDVRIVLVYLAVLAIGGSVGTALQFL